MLVEWILGMEMEAIYIIFMKDDNCVAAVVQKDAAWQMVCLRYIWKVLFCQWRHF